MREGTVKYKLKNYLKIMGLKQLNLVMLNLTGVLYVTRND